MQRVYSRRFIQGTWMVTSTLLLVQCATPSDQTHARRRDGGDLVISSKVDDRLSGVENRDRRFSEGKAKELEQRLQKNPRDIDTLVNLAQMHLFAGRLAESRQTARRALLVKPGHSDAILVLAQVEFAAGNHGLTEFLLTKLSTESRSLSEVMVLKGLLALQKEELNVAATNFRMAIDADGENIAARMNLGVINLRFSQFNDAAIQFERILQKVPEHVDAKLHLAVAKSVLGDTKAADALYESVLAARRSDAAVIYNRGLNLHKMGRLEDSVALLRRAIDSEGIKGDSLAHAEKLVDAIEAQVKAEKQPKQQAKVKDQTLAH